MRAKINIQIACKIDHPNVQQLESWAQLALQDHPQSEVTIRLVEMDEIQQLNKTYRQKDTPTNVLSFPSDFPDELGLTLLGDIVICNQVVNDEARAQHKKQEAHWAHMVIHGCLHLLGYDHIHDVDADIMEALERKLLTILNFPNPY